MQRKPAVTESMAFVFGLERAKESLINGHFVRLKRVNEENCYKIETFKDKNDVIGTVEIVRYTNECE